MGRGWYPGPHRHKGPSGMLHFPLSWKQPALNAQALEAHSNPRAHQFPKVAAVQVGAEEHWP